MGVITLADSWAVLAPVRRVQPARWRSNDRAHLRKLRTTTLDPHFPDEGFLRVGLGEIG
jgi:hypothetical protein